MIESQVSDAAIAAMSPAERRDLIQRLERPLDELVSQPGFQRIRRIRIYLMTSATIMLVPWIVYLSTTLPDKYVAHNWEVTWVGFDILLLVFLGLTVLLAFLRRQLLVLSAFTCGVLLVCDAWFDVVTAAPNDLWVSIAIAVLVELPLAVLLVTGALRIVRLTMTRLWLLDPGVPLWRIPLLP
jgi:hypothetical protein